MTHNIADMQRQRQFCCQKYGGNWTEYARAKDEGEFIEIEDETGAVWCADRNSSSSSSSSSSGSSSGSSTSTSTSRQ
eukprot:11322029-Karenia_brevis.AAC.1